jgi:hypothetical protein
MHFRSRTAFAGLENEVLHTAGSATSCLVRTLVLGSGLETEVTTEAGGFAFLESDLLSTGEQEFQEKGAISFGDESEHLLRFSTIGQGHLTPQMVPGISAGSATWKVDGGEGQFAQACGFITATFTLSESGERTDYHCGLIFLPE